MGSFIDIVYSEVNVSKGVKVSGAEHNINGFGLSVLFDLIFWNFETFFFCFLFYIFFFVGFYPQQLSYIHEMNHLIIITATH